MSPGGRPTVEFAGLGPLAYRGSHWRGVVALGAFGAPFDLIVRAKRDGPSGAQATAMARLASDATSIRAAATRAMLERHREAGLVPDRDVAEDGIWSLLEPREIEVADAGYHRDGRIAILLIFGSREEEDFAPAIETADGMYVGVLSGT